MFVNNDMTIHSCNAQYSLPPNYKPKENKHARHQLDKLLENAQKDNMDLNYVSGYRSYNEQKKVVAAYEKKDGKMTAEQYTAFIIRLNNRYD